MIQYIQIILSVILTLLVLIQNTDASSGSVFGSGDVSSWKVRRGGEKFIFILTIIISISLLITAILNIK